MTGIHSNNFVFILNTGNFAGVARSHPGYLIGWVAQDGRIVQRP